MSLGFGKISRPPQLLIFWGFIYLFIFQLNGVLYSFVWWQDGSQNHKAFIILLQWSGSKPFF